MNVCSDIEIPIYNVWVQIVLVDDIWEYYQTMKISGIKEEVDDYRAVTLRGGIYQVIFRDDQYTVGCVAHEAFHIVKSVMKRIDTPLNCQTEETYAYLLTYLVDQMIETLLLLKLKKEEHGDTNSRKEAPQANVRVESLETS